MAENAPQKIAEYTHLENDGAENVQPGKQQHKKWMTQKMAEITHTGKQQKNLTWKMTEWKMHYLENGRNACTGIWNKLPTQKMTEWKKHDMENCRTENS